MLSLLLVASGVVTAPPCVGPAAGDAWYRDAVFYEVFVRSFQDSDGDGIGDLSGLIDRLDYLNDGDPKTTTDLGVTALWLMPIFSSPSYHGYDTTNYKQIDKDYGTLEDFRRLTREAGKRGIRIVLDLVMNHSSSQHPWFVKGKRGPSSPHHDYYVWADEAHKWGRPWDPAGQVWHRVGDEDRFYYGLFWGGMPDLNWHNPKVEAEFQDIAGFWLEQGAAGFRLDAARYLVENGGGAGQADQPQTHAIWRRMRKHLARKHPGHLLLGEVWTDLPTTVSYFGKGDELQMVFDFERQGAMRQAVGKGRAAPLRKALCASLKAQPARGGGRYGTFLTNHDQDRVATDLKDPAQLRLAASLLLTLPGVPFVYYGSELGMPNGAAQGDKARRGPMRWNDTAHDGFSTTAPWTPPLPGKSVAPASQQSRDPRSLQSHYRRLIHLRRSTPALSRGSTSILEIAHDGGSVLAFVRKAGDDTVIVVANLSAEPSRNVHDAANTVNLRHLPGRTLKILRADGTSLE